MYISILEKILRIIIALAIGALIGWERERNRRPAGLRTHMLVAVGSTIVIMTGFYCTNIVMETGIISSDPTRMAAQVISGIGFLGAGTILREGMTVKGLTTAASLWTVACLGLAVGAGNYFVAVVGAIAIFIVLTMVEKFEQSMKKANKTNAFVDIECWDASKALVGINKIINTHNAFSNDFKISEQHANDNQSLKYHISFTIETRRSLRTKIDWAKVLEEFKRLDGVVNISMEKF